MIKAALHIFFAQLGQGILYIYDRYGVVANHFNIDDGVNVYKISKYNGPTMSYVPAVDCIVVDNTYLRLMCTSMIKAASMILVPVEYWGRDYRLNVKDIMFLEGVEEAHHAYYIKSGKGLYRASYTEEEYRSDPIEQAAGEVVRQAIREQGIQLYIAQNGKCFPCIYPEC